MKLTDSFLRNAKPGAADQKHSDGGGLYILIVAKTGAKLWRLAYRFNGKQKTLSIGSYPLVSLREARERREDAKKLLLDGIDPGAQKQAVKASRAAEAANSFEAIAREWHSTYTGGLTEKHQAKIMYRLEKLLFPCIGGKPIAQLEAQDILIPVREAERQGHNETAHRLVQLVGQVFRFAIATGRAKHNIAADLKDALRPVKVKHRSTIIDPKRIGALLRAIDGYEGHFSSHFALRLAPLVFLRPGELRQGEWAELNLDAKEWRIPAERMKMPEMHIVPLADQAVAILRDLRRYSGQSRFLFPSVRTDSRPISDVTLLAALRRLGYTKEEMCTHGFRGMASTLLNEQGYNRDWIERQLAHAERDGVRAAYNYAEYLPERRRMMQEWADHLDSLKKN